MSEEQKQALKNAIEVLSFWASCFDYKNYSGKRPMYGGEQGCRDAENLLTDFVEEISQAENEPNEIQPQHSPCVGRKVEMKTIKFRGRRLDNKKWVYGNLRIHNAYDLNDGIHNSEPLRTYIEEQDLRWDTEEKCWRHVTYEVDPATVGQFTGLLDKHDTEKRGI